MKQIFARPDRYLSGLIPAILSLMLVTGCDNGSAGTALLGGGEEEETPPVRLYSVDVESGTIEASKRIDGTDLYAMVDMLTEDIQSYLREQMPAWRSQYPGVEEMDVAVMGCMVNGPGESKHANIGISLPGTGERPVAPVYEDGEKTVTLKGEQIAEEFQEIVTRYVQDRYGSAAD